MGSSERTVLITGATGQQGGAIARHLAGRGFHLKAMTRNPEGDRARALAELGLEVVRGDLDDPGSVSAALEGAWGAFAVQNTWEAGVEREEAQGRRFAHLAREAGVEHFVYSSVGSAHRNTGIPHFDNKWRVEETIRSLSFPSTVILRPVFFMENLPTPWFLHGDKLITALDPQTRVQMIAVDDIGFVGARAFVDAEAMNGEALDIAGDAATMVDAAKVLSETTGRPIEFVRIPIEEVRKNSEDFALMLEWFDAVGYDADIEALERRFDRRFVKLPQWAQTAR